MVALTAHFAALAALCAIAAPADAAIISMPRSQLTVLEASVSMTAPNNSSSFHHQNASSRADSGSHVLGNATYPHEHTKTKPTYSHAARSQESSNASPSKNRVDKPMLHLPSRVSKPPGVVPPIPPPLPKKTGNEKAKDGSSHDSDAHDKSSSSDSKSHHGSSKGHSSSKGDHHNDDKSHDRRDKVYHFGDDDSLVIGQTSGGNKVILNGSDDIIHVGLAVRSPHSHDHHYWHGHHKVVVNGDHDHVRVSRDPHRHWGHHGKVVVNGDHDHVRVSREPHHYHHHHDHWDGHRKVVVNGDHDHVRVSREPHHHHHHHHHHHDHWDDRRNVAVNEDNDHVRVSREPHHHHHGHWRGHDKVVVNGDHDHVRVSREPHRHHHHHDRDVDSVRASRAIGRYAMQSRSPSNLYLTHGETYVRPQKRQTQQGTPGIVDLQTVDGSSPGSVVASLVLATATNATDNSTHYVLDASQTNSTQMLLVPLPNNSSSSGTSGDSSTSSDGNSSMIPVTLQMNLFDPQQAMTVPYCATFGPDPNKPEPISMASCGSPDPGKSQRFAYEPDTNVLEPMFVDIQPTDNSTASDTPTSNSSSSASKRNTHRRQQSSQSSGQGQKVQLVFVPNEASTDGSAPSVDYADPSTTNDGAGSSDASDDPINDSDDNANDDDDGTSDNDSDDGDDDDSNGSSTSTNSSGPSNFSDVSSSASSSGTLSSTITSSIVTSSITVSPSATTPTPTPTSASEQNMVNAVQPPVNTPIFITGMVPSASMSSSTASPSPSSPSPESAALGVVVENMTPTGPQETPSSVNPSAIAASLAAQSDINDASGMSRRFKQEK